MSPSLIILCLETLALQVNINNSVRDAVVGNSMIKILRYADETQLLLDGTKDSLQEALHILNIFNVVSCLFINVEKSSLFPLRTVSGRDSSVS